MSQCGSTPSPHPPAQNADCVNVLNDAEELDFRTQYDIVFREGDLNDDPFAGININSKFYYMYTLPSILKDDVSPIYLSINIQSLNSKFDELRMQILDLVNKNVQIDVIALQEVWEIRDPNTVIIPGFQPLVYKTRANIRGGGVGFYVKGTVRPDWICMRVVSLKSPLKGHQPLYVFNFLFLILNF
jgi:hypothetical protein